MSNSTPFYLLNHAELRILILEDNPDDAFVLEHRLKKDFQGCQCMVAEDEIHFREALNDFTPDVVLADNSLVNFDAAKALQAVRKSSKQTIFILVTGMITDELATNIIREGGDDYIGKDRISKLSCAVNAALIRRAQQENKKLALSRLARRVEKYKMLVDTIADGLLALDAEGYITFMNEPAGRLLSRTARTSVGNILWQTYPSLAGSGFQLMLRQAFTDSRKVCSQQFLTETQKWVEAIVYPSSSGITIHLKDITKERAERELSLLAESKYTRFINRISEAFISLDNHWKYTFINARAAKMTKRSPGELLGRNVWEEFPMAVGSATYKAFHKAMETQQYICNEDYYAPLDIWQENHIYPSADGLSVFIRDISSQKKLEIAFHEKEKQAQREMIAVSIAAEEKERNAIGAELHDNVNQLLASTNLFLSLIRETPARASELVPMCMDTIKKAIQENRRIAHELVAPDLQGQSLSTQASGLFDTMLAPAGIAASISLRPEDEQRLDPQQKLAVYRILQEQCANILKYSGASRVDLVLNVHQESAHLSITDNGKGADLSATVKGIGLKNIASRVQVWDGEVKVDTSVGKGFKLEIRLPLVAGYNK